MHQKTVFSILTIKFLKVLNRNTIATANESIHIWKVNLMSNKDYVLEHDYSVNSLDRISYNLLATASSDSIQIWDLNRSHETNISCLQKIKLHNRSIKCVKQIYPQILASCSNDGTIKFLSTDTFSIQSIEKAHNGPVLCIELVDKYLLASGGEDGNINMWNLDDFSNKVSIKAHDKSVFCLKKYYLTKLVSGSADCTIKIWNIKDFSCLRVFNAHGSSVYCLEQIWGMIISGGADNEIKVWNLEGCIATLLPKHKDSVRCLLINNDNIFSGSADYTIQIRKRFCEDFYLIYSSESHENTVTCLKFV